MKRALLVGINYVGTQNELRGCINDINNVAAYLQTTRSYPARSCIVLSDATPRKPTRANILAAFNELLQDVRAGDEIHVFASARSFLHNQVRSMVGSLVSTGLTGPGAWSADDLSNALAARNRAACGPVAPPDGMYLMQVDY